MLACENVYAMHAIFSSGSLLRGGAKAIKACSDADRLKPDLDQVLTKLCLRQSTCNSTGP